MKLDLARLSEGILDDSLGEQKSVGQETASLHILWRVGNFFLGETMWTSNGGRDEETSHYLLNREVSESRRETQLFNQWRNLQPQNSNVSPVGDPSKRTSRRRLRPNPGHEPRWTSRTHRRSISFCSLMYPETEIPTASERVAFSPRLRFNRRDILSSYGDGSRTASSCEHQPLERFRHFISSDHIVHTALVLKKMITYICVL